MQLLELITDAQGADVNDRRQAAAVEVLGLTADSREVRPGFLFAAFPGAKKDGRAFIDAAVNRGAVAVLAPRGTEIGGNAAVLVEDDNPRRCFAKMAAAFYGHQVGVIVGVTGTNGKSSTVNFCRQIWRSMDHAAASLGTIGLTAHLKNNMGIERPATLTTPDPVVLHSEIAELEASGVTHLALEASSMGLHNYRLDGLRLTAAGFLNLTRDHLDDHGTMENYIDAKMRLFSELLPADGVAVINMDDPVSSRVKKICDDRGIRTIEIGRKGRDIRLNSHKPLPTGQFISVTIFGERYELELPLVGDFQAQNALMALGLVIAEDPDNRLLHMQCVYALERLQSVRGRLEFAAQLPNGATVYVDYAHSPDGLETMLKALRPHTPQKLHVVFGCGGDRDRGKRPMMGEIAVRLADVVIVTDDNPRTEDAAAVRADVMAGANSNGARKGATEIAGRREAIRTAVAALGPEDVLVIAGKGHEQGQIIGSDVLPFDDVTEARAAVLEMTK